MADEKTDTLTAQEGSSSGGSSLLDDLLKQNRLEADKEKLKLEKQLQDRQAAIRKQKEDEERRKREELKKRLEEETQRRQDLIRKKHGAEPDSAEVVQEKVAREAAVAQVLSTKSTMTKIERKPPSIVPVASAGGAALLFAALAIALYVQASALPTGLGGYRFALDNAVNASVLRARIKVAELKTAEIEGSVKTGSRTALDLRKEMDELKAAVAQRDQQIAALQAQIDATPKVTRPAGNGEKKNDGDNIKIDTSIFKGGKKR